MPFYLLLLYPQLSRRRRGDRLTAEVVLFYVIELVVAEQPVAAILTKEEARAMLEPFRRRLDTPGAQIQTTLGLPAHAQNGKNPPSVNPTHYQCYTVEAPANAATLKTLRDQFGAAEGVKLGKPLYLCAPTAKNGAAPKDRTTHYLCYEDEGVKPPNRKARIINQLTKDTGITLGVEKPVMLCVPSVKKLL